MKTKYIILSISLIIITAFVFGSISDIRFSEEINNTDKTDASLVGMFITENSIYEKHSAVLKEITEKDNNTGEIFKHKEYAFDNLCGISFYHCNIADKNGEYGFLHTDGILCDVNNSVTTEDNIEIYSINGVLYTVSVNSIFYANPVYQDAGGNVWLEPGDGIQFSGSGSSEISLGNEIKVTEGNSTKIRKYECTLQIKFANPTQKVTIAEMNKNDELLKKSEFTVSQIQTEYLPHEATEYIVVNEFYYSYDSSILQQRKVYDKANPSIEYTETDSSGIGIKKSCEIIFNDNM